MDLWGKCIPGRGKSQCKGPRAGAYLMCSENRKVASVTDAELRANYMELLELKMNECILK